MRDLQERSGASEFFPALLVSGLKKTPTEQNKKNKRQQKRKGWKTYKSRELRRQTPVISPDAAGHGGHNWRACTLRLVAFKSSLITRAALEGGNRMRETVGVEGKIKLKRREADQPADRP